MKIALDPQMGALPEGYSLEQDADGDWLLVPPETVTIFSVPGEPLFIGTCDRGTALSDALAFLAEIDPQDGARQGGAS
jgi:hypothetical protein